MRENVFIEMETEFTQKDTPDGGGASLTGV